MSTALPPIRFWQKGLFDLGYVPTKTQFKQLRHEGTIAARARGSSLLRHAAAPHGSLTPADDPLSEADSLFKEPGPPQPQRRHLSCYCSLPCLSG